MLIDALFHVVENELNELLEVNHVSLRDKEGTSIVIQGFWHHIEELLCHFYVDFLDFWSLWEGHWDLFDFAENDREKFFNHFDRVFSDLPYVIA